MRVKTEEELRRKAERAEAVRKIVQARRTQKKVRLAYFAALPYWRYLLTPYWLKKRAVVLKRDKGCCRFCGAKATQVHHLKYRKRGKEKTEDLVSVCRDCHEKEHGLQPLLQSIERSQRWKVDGVQHVEGR